MFVFGKVPCYNAKHTMYVLTLVELSLIQDASIKYDVNCPLG